MKRGQISVFILSGIIILLVIVLSSVYFKNKISIESEIDEDIYVKARPVKEFVNDCVKEVTLPSIYILADRGGVIYADKDMLRLENKSIAYHLDVNKDISPTKKEMEEELSELVKNTVIDCVDELEKFEEYDFERGKIDVRSTINEKNVVIDVNYPIVLKQNNTFFTISDFSIFYPIRLGHVLDIKDEILNNTNSRGDISIDLISSFDADVTVFAHNNHVTSFMIYDYRSNIENTPFFFNFAVKSKSEENAIPEVIRFSRQEAKVGEEFKFRVSARDDDELRFSDNTIMFNIDEETGEIRFTPLALDKGLHIIEIAITDGIHNIKRMMELNIAE